MDQEYLLDAMFALIIFVLTYLLTFLSFTAVTIADPDGNPPTYFELGEPASNTSSNSLKHHRASASKRLIGRLSKSSYEHLPSLTNLSLSRSPGSIQDGENPTTHEHTDHVNAHSRLLSSVTSWLHEERNKWSSNSSEDRMFSLFNLL
jgi:hypothetical protein